MNNYLRINNALCRVTIIFAALLCVGLSLWFSDSAASAEKAAKQIEVTPSYGDEVTDVDIQNALNLARDDKENSYYIKVPEGEYTFLNQNGLHIYSNTTLDITGCTFTKDKSLQQGAFIQVGYPRKETKTYGEWGELGTGYYWGKYSRGENIMIIGGTLDGGTRTNNITTLVTFSHVQNITFKDTVFTYKPTKRINPHLIEFGGSKNVVIDGCRFYGNKNTDEGIQLESTIKGVAHSDLMGKCDGTKTSNVTIKNCLFSGLQSPFGCNHGCSKDSYKNIVFKNNTFDKIGKYAIVTYNFSGTIKENIIKNSSKRTWNSTVLKLGNKNKIKMIKNVIK